METLVTQFLDSENINYQIKPHRRKAFTCEEAAQERGVRLSQIVKCIVGFDPEGNIHVMLIPGDQRLKLKQVRRVANGTKIDLVSPEALAEKFGLTVGAISPIQFVGKARFYMDNSLDREKLVDMSSGRPDAGIKLASEDLRRILAAVRCDIILTRK